MPTRSRSSAPPSTCAPPEDRDLQPIAFAAERYKVHTKTVRRYIAAGRLTGYRLGPRLLRVDIREADQLLRPIPTATRDEA